MCIKPGETCKFTCLSTSQLLGSFVWKHTHLEKTIGQIHEKREFWIYCKTLYLKKIKKLQFNVVSFLYEVVSLGSGCFELRIFALIHVKCALLASFLRVSHCLGASPAGNHARNLLLLALYKPPQLKLLHTRAGISFFVRCTSLWHSG